MITMITLCTSTHTRDDHFGIHQFRVHLVGGVEKWEDRKWWEDGKVGG